MKKQKSTANTAIKRKAAARRTERETALKAVFAARIEAFRVRKGWNQSELARQATLHLPPKSPGQKQGAAIGRDLISHYSRALMLPRPEYLTAIAKALGVSPSELMPNGRTAATQAAVELANSPPAFRMETTDDGRVWLRLNRTVSMTLAVKISNLLSEEDSGAMPVLSRRGVA